MSRIVVPSFLAPAQTQFVELSAKTLWSQRQIAIR
jgi:hypothetical protein